MERSELIAETEKSFNLMLLLFRLNVVDVHFFDEWYIDNVIWKWRKALND